VAKAFATGLSFFGNYAGVVGSWLVSIAVIFFAYSSMITWSYYGDRATTFLLGEKFATVYRIVFIIIIFFGATSPLQLVWQMADLANIFMAAPNLISLILLAPLVRQLAISYFDRLEKN